MKTDWREFFTIQIRDRQAQHSEAHASLVNWGLWSMDRRGIFPKEHTKPAIWDQFARSKVEDWGEEKRDPERVTAPMKAEPPEMKPYDEKSGHMMDERLHGPGGLGIEVRRALRIAYATRELPEDQFPAHAGCTPDAFLERLTMGLLFGERFRRAP